MQDVFTQILARLDNKTIANLIGSGLWELTLIAAKTRDFWRLRCQFILSPDKNMPNIQANWKLLYYILEEVRSHKINPFHSALAVELTIPEVVILLQLDYEVNAEALFEQVSNGSVAVMRYLLDHQVIIQADYIELLNTAASAGRVDMLDLLFERYTGLSLNWLLEQGLYSYSVVEYLLKQPEVDLDNLSVSSCISIISSARADVMKLLLSSGFDSTAKRQINPIEYARDEGVLRLLLQDARVEPDKYNEEPLLHAIHLDNKRMIELLLADGRVVPGRDALRQAIYSDNYEIVKLLLRDKREDEEMIGLTNSIQIAVEYQVNNSLRALLEEGIVPSDEDLVEAIHRKNVQGVELLLSSRAINPGRIQGLIVRVTNASILKLLLQDGRADPTVGNNAAISKTAHSNNISLLTLLLNDVRTSVPEGLISSLISKIGSAEVVRLVLEKSGEHTTYQDLEVAVDRHSSKLIDVVLRHSEVKSPPTIVLTIIYSELLDKLVGCYSAYKYVNGSGNCLTALRVQDSMIRELLKFLIVKRPTLLEVLRWLVSKNKKEIALAAYDWRYFRTDYTESSTRTAYYSLICLVEEGRAFTDIILELQREGADTNLTARLLGAYFGASRLSILSQGEHCFEKSREEVIELLR